MNQPIELTPQTVNSHQDFVRIPLTQGQFALVDSADADRVLQHKWMASRIKGRWYASRAITKPDGRQTIQYLHRYILEPLPGQHVDHAGASLDNRRYSADRHSGIRVATRSQNMANRSRPSHNTSGYIGVFPSGSGTFVAALGYQGKSLHLGTHATAREAAIVRNRKALELFGDFAILNIPTQPTVELSIAASSDLVNVSARLNELFADPNRDDYAFFSLLKDYVARMGNALVSQSQIEELTADVLFQILTSLALGKFKHQPEHNGSSFTRWVSGVTFRRAGDLKRAFHGAREVSASNVGTYVDDDVWVSADLTALALQLTDDEFDDSLKVESWPALVKETLERTRASISARDVDLFDEIRLRGEIKPSALSIGLKSGTAYSRLRSWSKLVESPGRRPSVTQGVPCSTRPGEALSVACVEGSTVAKVIRDAWRFSHPVVVMDATEFDAIANRGYTTHSAA